MYYPVDASQFLLAVGARSTAPDFREAADVMVKELNDRGGIAGRKVVAVHHGIRLQSPDRNGEDQAACGTFVNDQPVKAVISPGLQSDVLADCLAKAGIVYVFIGLTIDNAATLQRNPFQSEPISMVLDRVARVESDGVVAQGYLRHVPGSQAAALGLPVKLGVIAFDTPSFRDVYNRVLVPAYKAHRVPVSGSSGATPPPWARTSTAPCWPSPSGRSRT